jgi:hypothetical protein
MTLVRLIRREEISITGLMACLIVPAGLVLCWQFAQTFAGSQAKLQYTDTIIWAPLGLRELSSFRLGGWRFWRHAVPATLLLLHAGCGLMCVERYWRLLNQLDRLYAMVH